MNSKALAQAHQAYQEKSITGRYILPDTLNAYLQKLPSFFDVKQVGTSVEDRPIYGVKFGQGNTKILMWSQMHGNESTTTKSLLDFFNSMALTMGDNSAQNRAVKEVKKNTQNEEEEAVENWVQTLLKKCTFYILPMLNPDGSFLWTRNNANDVDLNRDAQDLSQPESRVLRQVFDDFKPDVCFNLHGQRTIYGFEETGLPSILSFLAPSADAGRGFPFSRKRSAHIITHIFSSLQKELKGSIGLYDDGFNRNCVGDAFQEMGVPTVLFEAGHYPGDYEREVTRRYIFMSLLYAIEAAVIKEAYEVDAYRAIPEHSKCFCDLAISVKGELQRIQYIEVLRDQEITFVMSPLDASLSTGLYAHEVVESDSFLTFDT